MSKSEITLIAIHATYASGHRDATYRSSAGIHAGQLRRGLVTPGGRPCKSMPASEPAPAKPVVVVEQTAEPQFVTLADPRGDGGAQAEVEVEVIASPEPASKRMPTCEDGEGNFAFYGRCVAAGFTRKQAAQAYRDQRDARKGESKRVDGVASLVGALRFPGNPLPREAYEPAQVPADADATSDVAAITSAREQRKLDERSLHGQADSLSASVKANREGIAAILALLSERS